MMKFHLHVVDGNAVSTSASAASTSASADTSESSAVLLFAHMTLRCGHLADVVAVSASTTPAAVRLAQLQQQQQQHGASASSGSASATVAIGGAAALANPNSADATESEDTKVLQAAGAVLMGAVGVDSDEAYALPYAPLADGGHVPIEPYAYFSTPFAAAERSLRHTIAAAAAQAQRPATSVTPPYYDLIATTDMTTFEYVLDYYQQLRVRYGGSVVGSCGGSGGTKPVGVLHIVAEDPSRAARVLQRVLEMVLQRSGWALAVDANAEEGEQAQADDDDDALAAQQQHNGGGEMDRLDGEEGNGGAAAAAAGAGSRAAKVDSWVNHIDEAVHVFAQLFGVDVLVALV
ncbi:hypothetical protein ABB37_08187 [Leptomonas pyrrhocoris]|uniref:Uncharacterized protein n=1 Tax=Leptomonas pyrrhocoris TaxID=157538 RepID=A0A0N0VDS8_LEPPY|nr:hypothetical protein ABB37_08187 [Leptomonas pyrrhocoris]KPA76051.1 hypothetical protein ABB37_08187 [Leptomonas pyrrhocoris]|eukprot:XP_015654490.1 hypothetical protein ABB37_08187 [Leptomonas pyrrhocoris]